MLENQGKQIAAQAKEIQDPKQELNHTEDKKIVALNKKLNEQDADSQQRMSTLF